MERKNRRNCLKFLTHQSHSQANVSIATSIWYIQQVCDIKYLRASVKTVAVLTQCIPSPGQTSLQWLEEEERAWERGPGIL